MVTQYFNACLYLLILFFFQEVMEAPYTPPMVVLHQLAMLPVLVEVVQCPRPRRCQVSASVTARPLELTPFYPKDMVYPIR